MATAPTARASVAQARIADLGCGTGTLSLVLAEMAYLVGGVDFSERMLEQAVREPRSADLAFQVGDAAAPPLPAGSYEAVICRHVLWALPEPAEALKRWGLKRPTSA
jgi:ubiquinone/menaquinone biosynthesis C-methylase UbiE